MYTIHLEIITGPYTNTEEIDKSEEAGSKTSLLKGDHFNTCLSLFENLCCDVLMYSVYFCSFHPLEVVSRYRDPQLQVGKTTHYTLKFGQLDNLILCETSHLSHSE